VVFYGALEYHLLTGNHGQVALIQAQLAALVEVMGDVMQEVFEGYLTLIEVLECLSNEQSPLGGVAAVTGEVDAAQLAQVINADAELDKAIVILCKHLLVTEIRQQRAEGAFVGEMTWEESCDGAYPFFEEVCLAPLSTTSMYRTVQVCHTACRLMSLLNV
jgi:hypothetical protein